MQNSPQVLCGAESLGWSHREYKVERAVLVVQVTSVEDVVRASLVCHFVNLPKRDFHLEGKDGAAQGIPHLHANDCRGGAL